MKKIFLFFIILVISTLSSNAQNHEDFLNSISTRNDSPDNFGTWSGTIRLGGGLYGTVFSYVTPVTVGLLRAFKFTNWSETDYLNWTKEQHGVFRFFNIGGDILIPNWTMKGTKTTIELLRPLEDYQADGFLDGGLKQYTTYVGYYFNWRSPTSGVGLFFGADYEWRNFLIHYPYPNVSYNKIHSLVPTFGLRYSLFDPIRFDRTLKFSIFLEAGMSYIFNVKYDNMDDYGLETLNNGFRPILGVAVTTTRFGSIHLRWTKDLYSLFNKDYQATNGFLYDNEIDNTFSCLSIGWAIFL